MHYPPANNTNAGTRRECSTLQQQQIRKYIQELAIICEKRVLNIFKEPPFLQRTCGYACEALSYRRVLSFNFCRVRKVALSGLRKVSYIDSARIIDDNFAGGAPSHIVSLCIQYLHSSSLFYVKFFCSHWHWFFMQDDQYLCTLWWMWHALCFLLVLHHSQREKVQKPHKQTHRRRRILN